jgi:hypothetical protein
MSTMYSTAERVVAWLGDTISNESAAFSSIPQVMTMLNEYNKSHPEPFRDFEYDDPIVRASMATLLAKPYWSRMWVIQEFLLAQTLEIWCGEHRADYKGFAEVVQAVNVVDDSYTPRFDEILKSPGRMLIVYKHEYQLKEPEVFKLEAFLTCFTTSKCTVKRDKVYALVGVAHDAQKAAYPIIPDYSKPAVEVFIDVLRNQFGEEIPEEHQKEQHIQQYPPNEVFEHLRYTLGVSRTDLAQYVAQRTPDIEAYMIILATRLRLTASLRFIGSVSRWDNQFIGSLFNLQAGAPAIIHDCTAHERILYESIVEFATTAFIHEFTKQATITKVEGSAKCGSTGVLELATKLAQSFRTCAELITTLTEAGEVPASRGRRNYLHCTNGIRAYTTAHWYESPTECRLAVLEDTDQPRSALIVDSRFRTILGVAYLVQEEHILGVEEREDEAEVIEQVQIESRDLADLLHLMAWGVADEQQLQALLAEALTAEAEDETFRSSGGDEDTPAGTIRFESAVSEGGMP